MAKQRYIKEFRTEHVPAGKVAVYFLFFWVHIGPLDKSWREPMSHMSSKALKIEVLYPGSKARWMGGWSPQEREAWEFPEVVKEISLAVSTDLPFSQLPKCKHDVSSTRDPWRSWRISPQLSTESPCEPQDLAERQVPCSTVASPFFLKTWSVFHAPRGQTVLRTNCVSWV